MSDAPLRVCPECSGSLRKLLYPVGVQFKGSGFYTTDYRDAGSAKGDGPAKGDGAGGSGDTGSSSGESKSGGSDSSEKKPEKKAEKKAEPAAGKD